MKKFLTYIVILSLFFVCGFKSVTAKDYELSLSAYNVTNSCNVLYDEANDIDGAYECFERAYAGELDSNKITDSLIKADQTIMVLFNFKTLNTASVADIYMAQFTLSYDTTKLTPIMDPIKEENAGASIANTSFLNDLFPKKIKKQWLVDDSITYDPSGFVTMLATDDGNTNKAMLKVETEVPVFAAFFKVNSDIPSGAEAPLSIKTTFPAETNFSDVTGDIVLELSDYFELKNLTLSTGGASSDEKDTDATLKSVVATGNTGATSYTYPLNEPFNSATEAYNIIVPNSVSTITFTGETTKPVNAVNGFDTPHNLSVGSNIIMIKVTAADAVTTKTYVFNVTRLSNDSSLRSIEVKYNDNGTEKSLNFGSLSSGVLEYTASDSVPYKVTSASATIDANYATATLDKTPTWTLNTDNNNDIKNTFTVNVKSEECDPKYASVPGIPTTCPESNYKFNITRKAPSKDLSLDNLTLDGVQIEGFTSTKDNYSIVVPQDKSSISIDAVIHDKLNTIESGIGNNLSLNYGDNDFTIVAKSEDGVTKKEYNIKIHRAIPYLKSLTITPTPTDSTGTLSPTFNASGNKDYTYSFDATTTDIKIKATVEDTDHAYVTINEMTDTDDGSDTTSKTLNTQTKSFANTTKKVKIIVTDANNDNYEYTITFARAKSSNNNLKALTITPSNNTEHGTGLKEEFKKNKLNYTAEVNADVTSVTVVGTPDDARSKSVVVNGNTNLKIGTNNVTVVVTAENDITKTYTIVVTRKQYSIAELEDLKVGIGSTSPTTVTGWNKNTLEYNLFKEGINEVPYETDSATISYSVNPTYNQSVSSDTITSNPKTVSLNTGLNTFKIKVTSQDKTTEKEYIIKIYRAKNVDNATKSVKVKDVVATQKEGEINAYTVTLPNSVTSINASDVVITAGDGATIQKLTSTLDLSTTNDNIFNYSIMSESGDLVLYKIYIVREKSEAAEMSVMKLKIDKEGEDYTYSCIINEKNECTINVPNGTSAYFLKADISPEASISPSNETRYEMDASIKQHTFTVTPESGNAENQKVYKITVKRALSTNTDLQTLTLTDVTDSSNLKDIPFSYSGGTLINITVAPEVSKVKLNATLKDSLSTIITDLDTVYNLEFGMNQLEIEVRPEDPDHSNTIYHININREKSSDATLSSLILGSDTSSILTGSETTYNYTDQAYTTTSLNVHATTNDALAVISKITVNGSDVTFTSANDVVTSVPLKTGNNAVVIEVESQRGDKNTYNINVKRALNNDTGIASISVNTGEKTIPATLSSTDNHTFILDDFVPNSMTSITNSDITIKANDGALSTDPLANAIANTTTLETLDASGNAIENRVSILVTAEDGTTDTYYLIVKRTPSDVKDLRRVNLYANDSTTITTFTTFDGDATSGTINVTEDTTTFRLEGILKSDVSNVTFIDGPSYTLSPTESTKVVTARVTAEDKSTKDYQITIKKAASSNSYLGELKTNAGTSSLEEVTLTDDVNYYLTVPGTQDEIEIYARSFDPKSKVEVIGVDGDPIENTTDQVTFTRSLLYNSENGGKANEIKIRVTAQNSTNKTIYTLFVTREQNIDATLREITLNTDKTVIDTSTCVKHDSGVYNGKIVCTVDEVYDYEFASVRVGATNSDSTYGTYKVADNSINGPFNVALNTIYHGKDYTASEEYQNVINIRSFAHNESIYQDYVVLVKRKANTSTVVDKVEIYYDGGYHEATFNTIKNVYEITVPNVVAKLVLNGTNNGSVKVTPHTPAAPTDALATVTMDEIDLKTDDAVTENVNTHTFTVTSEDGTKKIYTMEITRELSSEARLDGIIVETYHDNTRLVDDGVYNKTFNKDTFDYNVTVGVDTNKIKLNITPTEGNKGTTDVLTEYNLVESTKTITIHSYAEDGSGPVTYTLNIQRAKNDKNDLQSVVVKDKNGNTYPVKFSDTSEDFSGPLEEDDRILKVTVPGDVDLVTVSATATTNLGSIVYSGSNKVDGTESDYSLPIKSITRASIRVISEFGSSKTYKLDIERSKRKIANLQNLSYSLISPGEPPEIHILNDLDGEGNKEYNLGTVPNEFSSIQIFATVAADSGASLSGDVGVFPILTKQNNQYVITVIAEDGVTTKTYTLSIERDASDEARLKALDVSDLTISPTFDKDIYEYAVTIPEEQDTFSCDNVRFEKLSSVSNAVCDEAISLENEETKDFHITVTPENEETSLIKVYTISVTRQASSNNYLKAIHVEGGTTPKINKEQTEYTISIPESNVGGDFTVTAELESELATISPSDLLTDGVTYNVSDGVIKMLVTAQDSTTKEYTFNIISATAHDATLVDLSVTGYPFTTVFDPTDYAYSLNKDLDRSNKQLIVYATPKNPNAMISYYHGNEEISDCSGLTTCAIDISKYVLGTYTIHVKVVPEDNDTTAEKDYTITYTKDRSTDNLLSNIRVMDPSIGSIKFSPGVTRYELPVENDINEVELRITPSSSFATVSVDGTPLDATQLVTISDLPEGEAKEVSIIVKSEKGENKEYVVAITRKGASLSSDNFLNNLSVTDYPFIGDTFNPSIPSYTIGTIPWNVTELTINATKNVESQTIEYYVNGEKQESNVVSIPKAENTTITVKVIAEDGSKNDYIIKLKKTADRTVNLANIEIDKGNLVFNENTYSYDVSVPKNTLQLNVVATAKNDTQSIVLNGENYISGSVKTINIVEDSTTLRFVVTSEFGNFQTYTITITRDNLEEVEEITSNDFGHTIESGYIKTVGENKTVTNMKDQLDNDNSKLEIWDANDENKLGEDEIVGTGCIVKLINDDSVVDRKVIVVKGDVDGDGTVDMIDAGKIANHYMGRITLTGASFIAAEIDGDTIVDMIDAGKIANHYMGRTLIPHRNSKE